MSQNPPPPTSQDKRASSLGSVADMNDPLPTLQEEDGDQDRSDSVVLQSNPQRPAISLDFAGRNTSVASAGSAGGASNSLPPIRPKSPPPPQGVMNKMRPRSISPPPPSGVAASRTRSGGSAQSPPLSAGSNFLDGTNDLMEVVPLKPSSDSKVTTTENSFRSRTYPSTDKPTTSGLAALRAKQGDTFRSMSDVTDGRKRNNNTNHNNVTGSTRPGNLFSDVKRTLSGGNTDSNPLSPTSGGSGLASNISRKSVLIRSTLARRSTATLSRLGSRGGSDGHSSYASSSVGTISNPSTFSLDNQRQNARQQTTGGVYRGYAQGDMVLFISDGIEDASPTNNAAVPRGAVSSSTILVNRYGYPHGEGNSVEERRGPYMYILGKVKQIHYEENAVYYTVTREDNGHDIRGDAGYMEPIRTGEGLDAAKRAADGANADMEFDDGSGATNVPEEKRCLLHCIENFFVLLLLPFIWIYDIFVFVIGARLFRWGKMIFKSARNQGSLFLNGLPPYEFSVRLTTVNIIVLCSTWYMFIDQMRLAFFPPDADYTLAVINFIIWTILIMELVFEVFIHPDGYFHLIRSDKAFTPTTVRYISWFHLIAEAVALGFFAPEFWCLFNADLVCDGRAKFSFLRTTLMTITGSNRMEALAGRAFYACVRLRVFGLVRHWRNMWIRKNFIKRKTDHVKFVNSQQSIDRSIRRVSVGGDNASIVSSGLASMRNTRVQRKQRGADVITASNIGTALMVTNSYRSLTMLCLVMGIFPMISLIYYQGVVNPVGYELVDYLQGINLQVTLEDSTNCAYLAESVVSWVESFALRNTSSVTAGTNAFLLGLAIKPARCVSYFTNLTVGGIVFYPNLCPRWNSDGAELCILGRLHGIVGNTSLEAVSSTLGIRVGNIVTEVSAAVNRTFTTSDGFMGETSFAASAAFNYTHSTEASAMLSFLLQLCLLLTILASLVLLRHDAEHLVLRPLRSMLKIVARYAKNPLAQGAFAERDQMSIVSDTESDQSLDDDASDGDGFGTYETEQLISAVSKITDLLRKCWGVAGADIISTNLASREGELAEVFNPTVPGKSVYALFAFAAINGFDHALKCLAGDVMILINDVAQVLHGEVFRWGFGDSGQCNKNLGNAFLMVFRIGLVKEVVEKLEEATRVVFSTSEVKKVNARKRSREKLPSHARKASTDSFNPMDRLRTAPNSYSGLKSAEKPKRRDSMADAMQLSLQSLPGISTFTDRAVIGMLKSFAGIHRDKKLLSWSRDFRLSAGVGAWSVNMIFGMDAGWAVEGAVGSEYKIDATYLSPHVNMASRMMSACKHYGVTILLSEAVQELMSEQAKSRLRNLDRVTVKGSTQVQNIYTYDARSTGADFFLYSRSDEQADLEAERYQPNIWYDDQDLKAMRHHLTDDFEQEFMTGMKYYYEGSWPEAIERLEKANEIMVEAAMEEGYLHDEMDNSPDRKELYRTETADGPCKYLINFMKSQGSKAPPNWAGWHPLLSK
jgi:hypothetical protein